MGTKVFYHMIERHLQMLHQSHLTARLIVEGHRGIKNRHISGFLYVSSCAENQPHRIIIESSSDIVVTTSGERLILMIASSVGKLSGGYVYYTFTRSLRNLMHETN